MLASLLVGVFAIAGGVLLRPRAHPDEVHVRGRVARTWSGHAFGSPERLYEVEFRDRSGAGHTFCPAAVGGRPQPLGGPVEVAYRPHDPVGTARRTDGPDRWLHLVPVAAGVALLVGSAASLLG